MPDVSMLPPRPRRTRHTLPAVLMRAGTSKGLFIHRHDLPQDPAQWASPILAAMGSYVPDPKQIDGLGGATSTTSKVAVVAPSRRPGVDVDYTFVQVGVGSQTVDLTGNCGNMCSGVGPFALQEGLVKPAPGERTIKVRIFNTNTSRHIEETLEIDEDGEFREDGEYTIPGVQGTGSEVKVAFLDPSGSMTGKLFPTGARSESMEVSDCALSPAPFVVETTLIDAANPFVLVDARSLPRFMQGVDPGHPAFLEGIEAIRQAGAVEMGLAETIATAALVRGTPKLAVLYPPSGSTILTKDAQIRVQSFSMGKPHPSLQLTGAACLAAATSIEGTIAHRLSNSMIDLMLPTPERTPSPSSVDGAIDFMNTKGFASGKVQQRIEQQVAITHSKGLISVKVALSRSADEVHVERCEVSRTARRIFEGQVYCYY